jgi:flagellar basal body-associated protein FliL
MSDEIIFSIFGIIIILFVMVHTLKANEKKVLKTKEQKKAEIIAQYRLDLKNTLASLENDKQAKMTKKTLMLKQFSDELSRNIFFDNDEIRDIILSLANQD